MKVYSVKINLDKIKEENIFKGKKGIYVDLIATIFDKPNEFGNEMSLTISQTKAEREAKAKRVYVGDGKCIRS